MVLPRGHGIFLLARVLAPFHHKESGKHVAIFACRLSIYCTSLMSLLSTHRSKIYAAVRFNDNSDELNVSRPYDEGANFNSVLTGFSINLWLDEVLAVFHGMVTNVSESARLQEECEVLGLGLSRVTSGPVNLAKYQSCMLDFHRPLLPTDWSAAHEVDWRWLWKNVVQI